MVPIQDDPNYRDLENMNPNIRIPYCKPYWSDTEPNNFGYPLSLTQLGYLSQK